MNFKSLLIVKSYFLGKIRKNISKCRLLKILSRILRLQATSCMLFDTITKTRLIEYIENFTSKN